MKNNFRKNFIWNIIGTTFSSFNSLFFMIIATRVNGINDAGIFTFAFSTACLLYVIGIYSGRTFQITDNEKEISDSDYFYSKIFTCFLMFLISIVFCILRNYSLYKVVIIIELVLYKLCEAISESSFAVLQKNDKLYIVGKSLFYKALGSLILFLIVDLITNNLILASLMIVLCNFLFILLYDLKKLSKLGFKLEKFNFYNVHRLLKKGFFAFAFTFLTLYVINASKYSIDYLLPNKYQTVYGIISMPATILILFGQYIIQPFLLVLKKKLKTKKSDFVKITLQLSGILLIFGIICILFIYLFGIPILQLLYNINLEVYLVDLIIIIIGAILYAISVVFSTSLTTMRYTFCQFIIFLITSVIATTLSYVLILDFKVFGASLSYTLSMFVMLILYITIFFIKVKSYGGDNDE